MTNMNIDGFGVSRETRKIKNNKRRNTMKNTMKKMWLALAAFAVIGFASEAKATYPNPSQHIDINVSITASKSLEVDTTYYTFGALPISSTAVSGSSITVTNDSGGLVETYTITGASAVAVGVGTDWVLSSVGTPGQDQYALSAQFSDNFGNIQSSWANDYLNYNPTACTSDIFGNGTAGESGAAVANNGIRGLWFRMKTPTAVTDSVQHKSTLTLAVQ